MPHQVRNRSAWPAELVVVSQPPSHGDRIESAPPAGELDPGMMSPPEAARRAGKSASPC